jgi:aspartate racemase
MSRLGILGGMGPAAGAQFLARVIALTPAARDQEHIPALLWSDPRIPPRDAAPGSEDPLPAMRDALEALERAGCDVLAIACNTAHAWHAALAVGRRARLLHIVEATAEEAAAHGLADAPLGLLATPATLRLGLYQARFPALILPTAQEMTGLVAPAIAAVKANRLDEARSLAANAAQALAARGAAAILLGCTEFPLALDAAAAGLPLVDSTDALARAAIRAMGRAPL